MTFYGLIIWGTYLLISIVPRYKNPAIKIFFNFLDLCFGVYLFVLFIYANKLYFNQGFAKCYTDAPVSAFFTELFLYVTYVLFVVLALALITFVFRKFLRNQPEENEELDEWLLIIWINVIYMLNHCSLMKQFKKSFFYFIYKKKHIKK